MNDHERHNLKEPTQTIHTLLKGTIPHIFAQQDILVRFAVADFSRHSLTPKTGSSTGHESEHRMHSGPIETDVQLD